MMPVFRAGRPEERDVVLSIWKAAAQGEFSTWDDEYPGIYEAEHDLEIGALFVLEEDGAIIGTISIEEDEAVQALPFWQTALRHPGEFARVAVVPGYQGRGLAKLLVQGIEHELRHRGCDGVRLLAAICNIPACRTYEKSGYCTSGTCFMYGHDYYGMEKRFTEEKNT